MAAVEKLEHFNRKVSQWLEWVGFAGILTIIFMTTLDVIGAKVFLKPIFGALDVVILAQLIAASFTVSATLLAGRHVRVDFFIVSLSNRWRTAVDTFVYSLAFVFFVIIVWRLAMYAYSLQTGGEVSPTARISLYPYAYAAAVACIPVCLIYLSKIIITLTRSTKE
jgi:TRAP-type C4-dicarboxylate transport system permease small subunit